MMALHVDVFEVLTESDFVIVSFRCLAKFFVLIAKHLSRTEIISLYRRWISFRE